VAVRARSRKNSIRLPAVRPTDEPRSRFLAGAHRVASREGKSTHDVAVNVVRVEPPPKQSAETAERTSEGDGHLTPATMPGRIIEDYYRLQIARGPARRAQFMGAPLDGTSSTATSGVSRRPRSSRFAMRRCKGRRTKDRVSDRLRDRRFRATPFRSSSNSNNSRSRRRNSTFRRAPMATLLLRSSSNLHRTSNVDSRRSRRRIATFVPSFPLRRALCILAWELHLLHLRKQSLRRVWRRRS
jgi:hypothetical protein